MIQTAATFGEHHDPIFPVVDPERSNGIARCDCRARSDRRFISRRHALSICGLGPCRGWERARDLHPTRWCFYLHRSARLVACRLRPQRIRRRVRIGHRVDRQSRGRSPRATFRLRHQNRHDRYRSLFGHRRLFGPGFRPSAGADELALRRQRQFGYWGGAPLCPSGLLSMARSWERT